MHDYETWNTKHKHETNTKRKCCTRLRVCKVLQGYGVVHKVWLSVVVICIDTIHNWHGAVENMVTINSLRQYLHRNTGLVFAETFAFHVARSKVSPPSTIGPTAPWPVRRPVIRDTVSACNNISVFLWYDTVWEWWTRLLYFIPRGVYELET